MDEDEATALERELQKATKLYHLNIAYGKLCVILIAVAGGVILGGFIGFVLGFSFGQSPNSISHHHAGESGLTKILENLLPSAPHYYNHSHQHIDIEMNQSSIQDAILIKEAEIKCANKQCCREDDDAMTDASACTEYSYLQCLSSANQCVWDCNAPPIASSHSFHYDRSFVGINKHEAIGLDETPKSLKAVDDKTVNTIDINLDYTTMDECGTLYGFHTNDHYNRYKFEEHKSSESNAKELVEMYHRRLGILGNDDREDVGEWRHPFYRNVYIEYQSKNGAHRCSGALISPRHVLTAGHCVSDGYGNFHWNFVNVPNFGAGSSRFKAFDYEDIFVFSEWHNNHDYNYDMGIITLKTADTGFGWFGFGYSDNIDQGWNFDVNGYPADKDFKMQRQSVFMDFGIYENMLQTSHGDIIQGNSGGPMWYTSDKIIYGVVSHEIYLDFYPEPFYYANGFTRITPAKYQVMCAYVTKWTAGYSWSGC